MKVNKVDDNNEHCTLGPFGFQAVSSFDGYTIYKQVDSLQENLLIVSDEDLEVVRCIRFNQATDKLEIL